MEKPVESVHNRMYTVVIIVACGYVKNEMQEKTELFAIKNFGK